MLLRQEAGPGVGVLSVSGPVVETDIPHLISAVIRGLDRGEGVVVDLSEVHTLAQAVTQALCVLTGDHWPVPGVRVCGASWPDAPTCWQGELSAAVRHLDATEGGLRQRLVISPGPAGPGQGRAAALSFLARLGLSHVVDDVVLVVSEMVTNAVRHGSGPVTLELEHDAHAVVIGVRDASPQRPVARTAGSDSEGGRGLELVNLLCVAHGVRPATAGKTVWGTLRAP